LLLTLADPSSPEFYFGIAQREKTEFENNGLKGMYAKSGVAQCYLLPLYDPHLINQILLSRVPIHRKTNKIIQLMS
jgi:hypothetical protein